MTKNNGFYILLASGFSKRFGSPKLLHNLDSQHTIIGASIAALKASQCPFLVAVRADDSDLRDHLESMELNTVVINTAHLGMSNVIAECVTQVDTKGVEWLGICLADMPYIQSRTFAVLSAHASAESVIRPRYEGRLGHPVLFGKRFFDALSKLEGDDGAKSVVQGHADSLKAIDVDDAMIFHDIDVPADILPT